jgi:glycosyltransferase involved in cell wall biosynthesis
VEAPLVTLGVPVHAGGEDLRRTLEAIGGQSYRNIDVLVSVDNGDAASAGIARPFLEDPRFRLHLHDRRLGWDGNTDWTIRNRRGDFYIYHQHDDRVSPTYVADLVAAAARHGEASILYSKMLLSGTQDLMVRMPSIAGAPVDRALAHVGRMDAAPLRGLIRGSALDRTRGLSSGEPNRFAVEHRFLTELALAGEFRLVEGPTYYKRMHGKNLSLKYPGWDEARKRAAWAWLCAALIGVLVPAGRNPEERWRLTIAVLDRFLVVRGGINWLRAPKRWLYRQDNVLLRAVRAGLDRARRGGRLDLWAGARSRHTFCAIDMKDDEGRLALLDDIFGQLRTDMADLEAQLGTDPDTARRRAAGALGIRCD